VVTMKNAVIWGVTLCGSWCYTSSCPRDTAFFINITAGTKVLLYEFTIFFSFCDEMFSVSVCLLGLGEFFFSLADFVVRTCFV
jgi:hypothetical protein